METSPPLVEKATVCLLLVLMMILHIAFSQAGLKGSLLPLWEWRNFGRERERTQRQIEQDLRFEMELLKTRMQNFSKVSKALTNLVFFLSLASFWRLLRTPSVVILVQWLALLAGYAMHRFCEGRITTHFQFRCMECVGLSAHFVCTLTAFWETDLVLFFVQDKMLGVTLGFASLFFIDLQVVFTVYVMEAVLLTYRCWQLVGFDTLPDHPVLIFASVTSHVLCAATIALVDINVRSTIRATQTSGAAFQLIRGFREVLRGVCDGDVLLDSNCTIVEDANCLERLLRSNRSLSETNFLDLFLDSESRDAFLHFMVLEDKKLENVPGMPRGLRVSLQGACGPVSLDLFHTRLPNQGDGNGYCLLAMKEDPEQKAPPEAPLQSVPSVTVSTLQPTHSRSSDAEVVEALDELTEIALLINNSSRCLDIVEAHLSFHRNSFAPTVGMPTLRKFIRPSDWDRIERMIENIMNLPPETEVERRCYFRHPMLFRLPGASRSYLRSKQTSLRLAGRSAEDPGGSTYYWMHLSSFDDSHVLRPREQYLEEINEE